MATLTRDALIAPKTKTVEVDGGEIVIRQLLASEALDYQGRDLKGADILELIALSVSEPKLTAQDVGQIPNTIMNKIVTEVFAFNKLGDEAAADARDELKKTMR